MPAPPPAADAGEIWGSYSFFTLQPDSIQKPDSARDSPHAERCVPSSAVAAAVATRADPGWWPVDTAATTAPIAVAACHQQQWSQPVYVRESLQTAVADAVIGAIPQSRGRMEELESRGRMEELERILRENLVPVATTDT